MLVKSSSSTLERAILTSGEKSMGTSQTSPNDDKKIRRSEVPTTPLPSKSEGHEDISGQITDSTPSE